MVRIKEYGSMDMFHYFLIVLIVIFGGTGLSSLFGLMKLSITQPILAYPLLFVVYYVLLVVVDKILHKTLKV